MKHVISVSLGSDCRDHSVQTDILGEKFKIERIGTNGDMEKAEKLIKYYDGKVDAFGLGGIDLYICAGRKKFVLKDAKRLKDAACITPVIDGSGLKNTLERRTIRFLSQEGFINFVNKNVLLVCGVDRFGMAEALVKEKANVTFGDLIFGLNIPIPIKSLNVLGTVGGLLGPVISQLPFHYLYPTGSKQEVITNKFGKYYIENEIIAGDFLYIKKYLPEDIYGKTILTNTVTQQDIDLLAQRNAKVLITTTPELEGRSFGTNVMEAVLVALLHKPIEDITEEDYNKLLIQANFRPRVVKLDEVKIA